MRCIQLIAWVKTILVDRGNEKTITTTSTVVNKKTTQSNHKRKIHRESIYNAFDLINWSVNISLRCQFSFYFRMIVSQTIFNRLIGGTLFTIFQLKKVSFFSLDSFTFRRHPSAKWKGRNTEKNSSDEWTYWDRNRPNELVRNFHIFSKWNKNWWWFPMKNPAVALKSIIFDIFPFHIQ